MKYAKTIIDNLIGSFNNKNEGFSARKLTAFILILCIVFMHIEWGLDSKFSVEILICDLIGVAFFLGLITTDQIIRFKNNTNEKEPEKNTEER